MEPDGSHSVQYNRWNEDNINMDVQASQTTRERIYNTLCTGAIGIAVKAVGALATLVAIYIAGYLTGYHIHRCS